MSHTQRQAPSTRPSGAWAGWATFGAVILTLIGALNMFLIAQIGFLPAYPIWSAIIILLDILVILALTACWDEAWAAM